MKLFSRKSSSVPTRRVSEPERRTDFDAAGQFRRNRTFSGVRREAFAAENSPRAKVHDLTTKRRKVAGIFALVLLGIGLLTLIITQLTAKVIIGGSTVALNTPIDATKYETIINDYLGTHPASRFRFILNEKELSEYAASLAPEVDRITQTGSVNIVETRFAMTFRKPVAGWQINGRQYYVDDQGIVFEKNYYATPTVQIVDESGVSPEQGSAVASARLLSFVGRVVSLAKASSYEVREVILPSATTRQVEIKLKGVKPYVKLSIDRGAGEQVEDMVRALRYLKSKNRNPSYVDVRVSGRAVYR